MVKMVAPTEISPALTEHASQGFGLSNIDPSSFVRPAVSRSQLLARIFDYFIPDPCDPKIFEEKPNGPPGMFNKARKNCGYAPVDRTEAEAVEVESGRSSEPSTVGTAVALGVGFAAFVRFGALGNARGLYRAPEGRQGGGTEGPLGNSQRGFLKPPRGWKKGKPGVEIIETIKRELGSVETQTPRKFTVDLGKPQAPLPPAVVEVRELWNAAQGELQYALVYEQKVLDFICIQRAAEVSPQLREEILRWTIPHRVGVYFRPSEYAGKTLPQIPQVLAELLQRGAKELATKTAEVGVWDSQALIKGLPAVRGKVTVRVFELDGETHYLALSQGKPLSYKSFQSTLTPAQREATFLEQMNEVFSEVKPSVQYQHLSYHLKWLD
jgi:hypothetical protein